MGAHMGLIMANPRELQQLVGGPPQWSRQDLARGVNEASWAWGHGRGQKVRPRPQIFFEAEATMYEAEARHVREQLKVCMNMKTKILAFRT